MSFAIRHIHLHLEVKKMYNYHGPLRRAIVYLAMGISPIAGLLIALASR
ncbi:MAG: hypothetical protein V1905_04020 [bacterium]